MQLSRAVRSWMMAFLWVSIGLLAVSPASAQDKKAKPPLSEALREALTKESPEAVQKRLMAAIEAEALDYTIDPQAMSALGLGYMQAGDAERGEVVMEILAASAQLMMKDIMGPEYMETMEEAEAADEARRNERSARAVASAEESRRAEESRTAERARATFGPARDDLERFHGLYAVPGRENGSLFLVRNCHGHLTMGATWGDVMPWVMRSLGETTFEYPGSSSTGSARVEITTGPDGKATSIKHGFDFFATPNPRTGNLPERWDPQCETAGTRSDAGR